MALIRVDFIASGRDRSRQPVEGVIPLAAVSAVVQTVLPEHGPAWRLILHGHELSDPITESSGHRVIEAMRAYCASASEE